MDEPATAVLNSTDPPSNAPTRVLDRRTTAPRESPTHSPSSANALPARNKMVWVLAALAVVIVLASVLGYRYYKSPTTSQIKSLAVLPFENRSGDSDADYLSDGLADSLIYRLSQLPDLRVSPTSSVIRYKGSSADSAQIARELDVDAVLLGRLMQRGDDLNISVQLIDTRTSTLIWAEQYDRKMSDLLTTQRQIATSLADKLQLKLVGDQAKGITKKYTDSNESYQLFMRADHHFAKRTKADMLRAIEYYRQAINLDPSFALAYARIAEVYFNLPPYAYMSPNEAIPEGRAAVQKALELDSTLSEAHTFNAIRLAAYEWKWADAESEFKRAIELDPKNSAAHFRYGQIYLLPAGRFNESIAEMKIALDMAPFDIVIASNYSWAHLAAGQNDKALEIAKKTYDLEPDHPQAQYYLAMAYNAKGMYSDALTIFDNEQKVPDSQRVLEQAGIAYARSGRQERAEEVVKKFVEIGKTQFIVPHRVAALHVALGKRDEAFAWLEKAFEAHDWHLHRLRVDPQFAPLRDDPRYKDLLKRLSLTE